MSQLLYLEGASGISGDMTAAALLDLGADKEKLDAVLKSLNLDGFQYRISRRKSHGLDGCDFEVLLDGHHPEDHPHGHPHEHHHEGHHHEHPHEHRHEEHHHGHPHEHRNLADVYEVIDRGEMTDRARELSRKIFRIVAEAEAAAHGCPLEEVHFHEVGALDSIVDIVSAAVLYDDLGITECVVTGLTEVPAVLNIAQANRIPLRLTDVKGEMVTPTGIAIAAALRTRDRLPESFLVEKIGIGLGKRDFGRPNLLRALLLREE